MSECPNCGGYAVYDVSPDDDRRNQLGDEYYCPDCDYSFVIWYEDDDQQETLFGEEG